MQTKHISRAFQPSERGLTLIEVLISLAILLAGIVAVAGMVPWAMQSDLISRNTSIASSVAQRELEQMVQQTLAFQGGGGSCSALSGQYYFCDAEGNTIGLGQTGAGSSPTSAGCPLDSTGQYIDFTQPASSCTSGYTLTEQVPWNAVNGVTQTAELRWRVVTMMNNGTPVRKFIIMGVRASQVGGPALVNNVQVVVGAQ